MRLARSSGLHSQKHRGQRRLERDPSFDFRTAEDRTPESAPRRLRGGGGGLRPTKVGTPTAGVGVGGLVRGLGEALEYVRSGALIAIEVERQIGRAALTV